MLRIHFLNVGHGDCTIIKHHSGRLTMIDINNSQDYDPDSFKDFKDFLAEQKRSENHLLSRSALAGIGAIALPPRNALAGIGDIGLSHRNALADVNTIGLPFQNALAGIGTTGLPQRGALTMGIRDILAQDREDKEKAKSELTDPIEFLQRNYPGQKLMRFVLTHPDLDHMRGIKALHDKIGFHNFWDTNHTKKTPTFRNDGDKIDWEFYQQLRAGSSKHYYTRGDSFFAFGKDENGRAGGDNIEILSPTNDLVRSCNEAGKSNSLSIVLRVSHAGKSVLLSGDAENDAWEIMANYYGNTLKSDFLKASHHGRDSGYNLSAVKLIAPIITFVSVGRKPDTDASSKYLQQCERVASTRYHGNIEVKIHDNGQHEWFVVRNPG